MSATYEKTFYEKTLDKILRLIQKESDPSKIHELTRAYETLRSANRFGNI